MEYHKLANLFPLLEGKELDALAKDIKENGLREPITTYKKQVLDGRNRYAACELAKVKPTFKEYDGDESKLLEFVISANLRRRHLNESQRAMIAASVANMERGGDKPSRNDSNFDSANLPNGNVSQAQAAEMFNVSERLLRDAVKIRSEADEDTIKEIERGDKTVSKAKKEIVKNERAVAVRSTPKINEEKQYHVILVDPPWKYNNTIRQGGTAEMHYETMPTADICGLLDKIELNITDNAVLFMWVTNPFLEDALEVVRAWGFEYKTNMVWVKTELQKPGSGFYVRGRHELLFICTRGSFTPLVDVAPPIGSVITAPVQEHSRKPNEQYDIIERLYPGCNYIELFSRQKREGWDSWGAESE